MMSDGQTNYDNAGKHGAQSRAVQIDKGAYSESARRESPMITKKALVLFGLAAISPMFSAES
jgi:hypothetical protein